MRQRDRETWKDLLLQNGANINSKNHNGLTPLHVASYCGESAIVNTLIEKGAEVNVKAKDGVTALHAAASKGNLDTIKLLINKGAEVDAKTSKDGLTPKDFASREGHETVVDILSKY
jgi:ankyrin repeat protein